jgi:hypothetical protein
MKASYMPSALFMVSPKHPGAMQRVDSALSNQQLFGEVAAYRMETEFFQMNFQIITRANYSEQIYLN